MNQNEKTIDLLQEETLSQKLIKKGFWLYLFSYLIAPGGYLIRLLISNSPEVSVADVGILYSIISLVNFLNVYNDLGLTESLQYFLPKFWIKKQYNQIKTTIWISLGVQFFTAVLIALGLWFGSDWLAAEYFQSPVAAKVLKYFCFYFLGINLFQTLQSIFIAFQKTFDYQFVEFVKIWATVGFTFFCFFTDRGSIEWYSLNWLLGLGIGILLAGLLYWKKYRAPLMQGSFERDKPMLKQYRNYALWAFLGANIGNVFGQVIQQMVMYFLGAEAAGYYANFLSLFFIGNIVIAPIMSLIFPMVSELIEKKDHQKLSNLISFFYSYFSVFTLSISTVLIIFGPEIASIIFGNKFKFSGELLTLGQIFLVFNILSWFNFGCLGGMGKVKERVKIMGISTLLLFIVSIPFLLFWGNYGATLAFGIGYVLIFLGSYMAMKRLGIKMHLDWQFIITNTIAFMVLGLRVFTEKEKHSFLSENRWFNFGQILGISILFYSILGVINYKKLFSLYKEIMHMKC
ncbi:MAG: hypothetical protein DLD55_01980 [candidate division SR1 bacterium]|nr:MAG: hypothetical protein DLD55_01980 [candidate division SR1 bacterium]